MSNYLEPTGITKAETAIVRDILCGYRQRIAIDGDLLEGVTIRPHAGLMPLVQSSLIELEIDFRIDGVPLRYDAEALLWRLNTTSNE